MLLHGRNALIQFLFGEVFGVRGDEPHVAEWILYAAGTLPIEQVCGLVKRRGAGVIILGVKPADGAMLFNRAPETPIRPSDYLIVIGADPQIKKLEAMASASS